MARTLMREVRRRRDLSQYRLAAISGVYPVHIGEIERRRRATWPKARRNIAAALGVEESYLFDAEGFARRAEEAEDGIDG